MSKWKEIIEGFLMCVGIFFFYLGAGATEQGYVAAGLIMFGCGFCMLCLVMALVVEKRL